MRINARRALDRCRVGLIRGQPAGWAEVRVRSSAVQLDAEDGGDGGSGGLGPVGVSGPFDVPLGHLAFDQSRVGSVPPDRVEAAAELHDGMTPAALSGLRGKNRAPVRWSGERDEELR
jgi:hypothetical protein